MKTVLIIEPVVSELESIMNFCRLSSDELTTISARDHQRSLTILDEKQIDLILCSTLFPDSEPCRVINDLAKAFTYIPIIAISESPEDDQGLALSSGASACFKKPLENETLLEQITELADASKLGTVRGVPLHSLLQMHENDGQSCTLHIFSDTSSGFIFLEDGTVINAEVGSLTGEAAFYELISWDEVIVDIRFFNGLSNREIGTPLISLIMEGFRLKDERNDTSQAPPTSLIKPKQRLEQISTTGLRLALELGQNLTVNFDSIDLTLESMLIGMIPEHCLIITTPSHFIVTQTEVTPGSVILVKFNHMEQLYLFRARITRVITTPQHVLFLEYPTIIHYHDIRKATRASASFPCLVKTQDGSVFNGIFKDISSTGALLHLTRKDNDALPDVDIRQPITLTCSLPEFNDKLELEGSIKNFKKDDQSLQIGAEFSKPYPLLDQSVDRYLQTIRLK